MERKPGSSSTRVMTAEEVKSRLQRDRTLAPEEERVLRMRHAASVDLRAPLARLASPESELEDELLLIETRLLQALRHRTRVNRAVQATGGGTAKAKIVRALRKKRVL